MIQIEQNKLNKNMLPPEWAKQQLVMLTWPHRESVWLDTIDEIDAVFVRVAYEIAKRELVVIAFFDLSHEKHIKALLIAAGVRMQNVALYQARSEDIWVRDHGPLTILSEDGTPVLLNFIFNGWGNKYPADDDNLLTERLAKQGAFPSCLFESVNTVLEGGAIEVDGAGTLLTTRRCLLAKTRNPHLTEKEMENKLRHYFGVKKILWLDHGGLEGDDTDGHIDTLARFANGKTILYVDCTDPKDSHYLEIKKMGEQLKTFKNVDDLPYSFIPLPWPGARFAKADGRRLPATYANFLIINDAVLVPTYDDPADQIALDVIAGCFKDREVIGIPCLPVIEWYGSLHCMTMQVPTKKHSG